MAVTRKCLSSFYYDFVVILCLRKNPACKIVANIQSCGMNGPVLLTCLIKRGGGGWLHSDDNYEMPHRHKLSSKCSSGRYTVKLDDVECLYSLLSPRIKFTARMLIHMSTQFWSPELPLKQHKHEDRNIIINSQYAWCRLINFKASQSTVVDGNYYYNAHLMQPKNWLLSPHSSPQPVRSRTTKTDLTRPAPPFISVKGAAGNRLVSINFKCGFDSERAKMMTVRCSSSDSKALLSKSSLQSTTDQAH